MIRRSLFCFSLVFSLFFSLNHSPLFAQNSAPERGGNLDEAIPNIELVFNNLGIGTVFSPARFAALRQVVDREFAHYESLSTEEKETRSLRRKLLPFITYARTIVVRGEANPREARSSYLLAKRVLYTIWSEDNSRLPQEALLPPDSIMRHGLRVVLDAAERATRRDIPAGTDVEKKIRQARQVLLNPLNVWVPFPNTSINEPIGEIRVNREAAFLVRPGQTQTLERGELATLSWKEIANLEVSESHPAWYSRATLARIGATASERWRHLESLLEKKISEELETEFSIAKARRIMFFDKIKTSATSPKVDAEDAFGMDWKVKWGDEIQTEVIANRLYITLGGKITDLVYANGPGIDGVPDRDDDGVIMILPKEDAEKRQEAEGKGQCYPTSAEELSRCLLSSDYRYNLAPNVFSSGVVDAAFFDRELRGKLPFHKKTEAQWRRKIEGSAYVTFRESMLELQPGNAALRAGAPALSSTAALEDRVARGLVLFNMWIANRDVKDANNKGYLLNLPNGTSFNAVTGDARDVYLEAQHDMGCSLGSLFAAGEINSLLGANFIRTCGAGRFICFHEGLLYLPDAWKAATFSDLVYMAERIVGITRTDLNWIAGETNWPKFMVEAVVEKLEERRNGIIEKLGASNLGLSGTPSLVRNNFSYSNTSEGLGLLTSDPRLPAEQIRTILDRETPGFSVNLLLNGVIANCADSKVMDFLQKELFPSGLAQRMSRLVDHQEEVGCAAQHGGWRDLFGSDN